MTACTPGIFFASLVYAHYLRVGVLASQDRAMQLIFEHQIDAIDTLADDALYPALSGGAAADDFEFRLGHFYLLEEHFPQKRRDAKFSSKDFSLPLAITAACRE